MDKAGELMQSMPADRAGRDMSGAVDFLADHEATTGDSIGVVGFCMGGMLSFILAALRPDKIKAVVPFYGFPQGDGQPDYSKITAVIRGHMAEHDDFFGPEAARELEARLQGLGLDATLTVHPGTGHAFMAPHNALGTQDDEAYAADLARRHRVPPRATRLSGRRRWPVSTLCSSTRAGCSCCPTRRCSGRCSPYYGGDGSVGAHRRAHYAAMAAKSSAGAVEADWVTYDEAYVRAVGVRRGRSSIEATQLLGVTRHAPLWRWADPRVAVAARSARRGRRSDGGGVQRQRPDRRRARTRGLPGGRRTARGDALRRRQRRSSAWRNPIRRSSTTRWCTSLTSNRAGSPTSATP